ncbi:MAG: S8 family serine peptidase, partial [Cyanobacteria bacterium J06632_22]
PLNPVLPDIGSLLQPLQSQLSLGIAATALEETTTALVDTINSLDNTLVTPAALTVLQAQAINTATHQPLSDQLLRTPISVAPSEISVQQLDPLLSPANDAGDSVSTAANLGTVAGRRSINGTLNGSDTQDWFRFQLDTRRDISLDLFNLSSDADLYLVQDRNGNSRIEDNEILDYSVASGTQSDHVHLNGQAAGTYYAVVNRYSSQDTGYRLNLTTDAAGETLSSAYNFSQLTDARQITDFVGSDDRLDYYRFTLANNSDVNLRLSNLSSDADLRVIHDSNVNGTVDAGEVIAASLRSRDLSEAIALDNLAAGEYFVEVSQYSGDTNYQLDLEAEARSSSRYQAGNFWANTFTHQSNHDLTVISGNGNVEFGQGERDVIDLSHIHSSHVSFNLVNGNGGGVVYNPGNGARLFDVLTLSNGDQILFEGIDQVQFANGNLNLSVVPNDEYFGYQWNLHMMGVHNAWRFGTGSDAVTIGVQDTGLGIAANGSLHPDLDAGRVRAISNNYADESYYELSHGSAVQSVIAAGSNNSIGMAGINWNSTVLSVDVLGGEAYDLSLAEATQIMIDEANSNDQRLVINMSLGADTGGVVYPDTDIARLIANNQENALFVIATGNGDNSYLAHPANLAARYENVIAVGASWGTQDYYGNETTPGERISYPGWWGSNYGTGLSLMGPSEVVAADATVYPWGADFSYTGTFNGTSAATPNVAGVASLVWSANPHLSATQVHQIMARTAYDMGASGYDPVYGNGFVNADAAVRMALAQA